MANKKYQVMITIGDAIIINGTNKQSKVDKWVKAFKETSVPDSELKIFQFDKMNYQLIHSAAVPKEESTERPIGFGRW